MQINNLLKYRLTLLLACLTVLGPSCSQKRPASSPAAVTESLKYPDTTAGLQQLLQVMLEAAKSNDSKSLGTLLKDTEIPNCDAWLHTTYKSDSADSWMGMCEAKTLHVKEESMMQRFATLAKEDGQILTRKVNDDPQPGRGMEWGMLQAVRQPVDIYFASWKMPDSPNAEPIGYFMFIEGGFRWDSRVQFVKPKILGSSSD